MKRKLWKTGKIIQLLSLFFFLMPSYLRAQEFPTKPINILVSFSAGGSGDIGCRILAKKAEKLLGQPMMITNNGAGGGSVALGIVAKQKPDGYHLVMCTATGLVQIPQMRTVTYTHKDFVPILHFAEPQSGTMIRGDSPWKTLIELVEHARQNPEKITYSTSGVGGQGHMAMEYVAIKAGLKWTHVPYPGNAPAATALLGGHVLALSAGLDVSPHIQAGTIRLLATHGEKRVVSFPDVPTFRELGYDFIPVVKSMIAAPKGTPQPIIKQLEEAFRKAMDDPEFLQVQTKMHSAVSYRNSEDTIKFLDEAYVLVGKMLVDLRIPREEEKK